MPICLAVDRRACDGAIQLCIEDGSTGYRIAGPKYDGRGKRLLSRELTKRDAEEIVQYLKRVK